MNYKSKGINAERNLIHLFWKLENWTAVRVAGSGSMHYPSPDIIAGNANRKLAIECKAIKGKYKYFEKTEIDQLLKFARLFNAEPWIALRFNRNNWYFLKPKDLKQTKNNFVTSIESTKQKGLTFKQIVSI